MDNFNIQIENPLTVLTQDQSRAFLGNSTPKEKYNVRCLLSGLQRHLTKPAQFWLVGTQLKQLTHEYEAIRANTEVMQELLDKKREHIPDLKEAYRQAKLKAKDAEAAANQRNKLAELQNMLAWSYVEETEAELVKSEKDLQNTSLRLDKLNKELESRAVRTRISYAPVPKEADTCLPCRTG